MTTQKTQKNKVDICEVEDANRNILMREKGNDLLMRSGRQVIEACRLDISVELWLQELNDMLEEFRSWLTDRKELIRSCYYSCQGSKIVHMISPASDRFDFDLADQLVEFGITLRKYNIGIIESHQIPWNEVTRFVDADSARWLYGEQIGTPDSVET